MKKDLGASVRARLLTIAKAEGSDFNLVLVRFALERLLYRRSQSEHADRFLLKGALLFTLWYDIPHRPTRDTDLLGFGPSDLESVMLWAAFLKKNELGMIPLGEVLIRLRTMIQPTLRLAAGSL